MDLKTKIIEFVEISETIPEKYRLKCFEILLASHISGNKANTEESTKAIPPLSTSTKKPPLHIQVKSFLTQYQIDETIVDKVFYREGEHVNPIYTLKATKGSEAQIGHALLLCLQEAINSGNFQTSHDILKEKCKDNKCYSAQNYKNNLKNNSKLFKDIDNDFLILTADGKAELSELLTSITN